MQPGRPKLVLLCIQGGFIDIQRMHNGIARK